MKNQFLPLFVLLILSSTTSYCTTFTWIGAPGSSWNIANNWSPTGVPGSNDYVSIIGGSIQLQNNTSINNINFNGGSIDVNGFEFNILNSNPGYSSIINVDINNSLSASTDIVFNINTGQFGYNVKMGNCIVNDKITFNLTGSNTFYEGDPGNQFNGNVVYNINGSMSMNLSYTSASTYSGNVSYNRTVEGPNYIFIYGAQVNGNFYYSNLLGGLNIFGNTSYSSIINGTCTIQCSYSTPDIFSLQRISNLTNGGSVTVNGSKGFQIEQDTLKLSSMSVLGYKGATYANLKHNKLNCDLFIEDDASYASGYATYLEDNYITGNSNFTINGFNTLYESNTANSKNTYNGNTIFSIQNSAALYICQQDKSTFNGHLQIQRSVDGYTKIFNSGSIINGNFSYTNSAGGDNYIGNLNSQTAISGMINIQANLNPIGNFVLYKVQNQTPGGKINVHNSKGFDLKSDSLKVDSLNIISYRGNNYSYFYDNKIIGHLTLADSISNINGYRTYMQNNTVNGNTSIRIYGSNAFEEASSLGLPNTFNGNVHFDILGTANVYICYKEKSSYNGNLSIQRTGDGYTQIFPKGSAISGNFILDKQSNGATEIGALSSKTLIGGTIDLNIAQSQTDIFTLLNIENQTNGGNILIQNTKGLSIQKDTIRANTFAIDAYSGNAYAVVSDNHIQATFTLSDDVNYTTGYNTQFRRNTIIGNSTFTILGSNTFLEADAPNSANSYQGNVAILCNGTSTLSVSSGSASLFNGNLIVDRTMNGISTMFNAGSTISGNFSFTKNAAGNSTFGNSLIQTTIGGTIDIHITQNMTSDFKLLNLKNNNNGGNIFVDHTKAFVIEKDSLQIGLLSIKNYSGIGHSYLENNFIDGNIYVKDSSNYNSGYITSFNSNYITGTSDIVMNGSNQFNDASGTNSGSTYIGDVSYTRNGGPMSIGLLDTNSYAGNLTFSSNASITNNYIRFIGSTNATLSKTGTSILEINRLIMNKSSKATLTLNSPVYINNVGIFNSGFIISSISNPLIFVENAIQAQASNNSHTIGVVDKIGNDAFSFPLGNSEGYFPISISAPGSISSHFRANFINHNPSNDGYDIALKDVSISQIAPFYYWTLEQLVGSDAEIVSVSWDGPCSNNGISNLNDLIVARWNGNLWNNLGNGNITGNSLQGTVSSLNNTPNYNVFALGTETSLNLWDIVSISATNTTVCQGYLSTLTASGSANYIWEPGTSIGSTYNVNPTSTTTYTVTGTSASGCITTATHTITAIACPTVLTTKAFIQGYYIGSGLQQEVLYNQGEYALSNGVCDSIEISLCETTYPYAVQYNNKVPILANGNIVSNYLNIIDKAFFIKLNHRNGIETWSASPITMTANTMYDFTGADSKAFGNNQIEVEPNIWAIYSCDVNQDGFVDIFDFLEWDIDNQNFAAGYYTTDFNGDGFIDIFDFLIWDPNNQNFIGLLTP
ncbi:MAG: hypothetical protein R2831_12140 [Chitinophagaceae bacterium]